MSEKQNDVTVDLPEDRLTRAKRLMAEACDLAGEHPARLFVETLRERGDGGKDAQKAAHRAERELRFRKLLKRSRIRELPAAAIVPAVLQSAVALSAINEESGHPNHAEMLYVLALASWRAPHVVVEFGTFLGRTTLHLARACPTAQVYTIDLPPEHNPWAFGPFVGSYYRDASERERIHEVRTDSRELDTAPWRSRVDVVWVDGDHSYDFVRNDTSKAFEMVAPDGLIMWHDYSPDSIEVAEYVAEFTQQQPLFRIRHTSVLMHIDGVDPLAFEPRFVPFTKTLFKPRTVGKTR